jgi:hypothetical protein
MRFIFLIVFLIFSKPSYSSICDKVLPSFEPKFLEQYFGLDQILKAFKEKNELYEFFVGMKVNKSFIIKREPVNEYYEFLSLYLGHRYTDLPIDKIIDSMGDGNKYIVEYLLDNVSPSHVRYKELISIYSGYSFNSDRLALERLWSGMERNGGYSSFLIHTNVYAASEVGSIPSIMKLMEIYRDSECDNNYALLSTLAKVIERKK